MVKMHNMVMHILLGDHQVANQIGRLGNFDPQCIFHRADRGKRMHRGAHPAGALGKSPGLTRVTPYKDFFDAAYHCAGGISLGDLIIAIQGSFNTQMAFNTGNWVNNNSLWHSIFLIPPMRRRPSGSGRPL